MGIETKIKSLGVPQTKILEFSFSTGGHFEKWPKRAVSPRIFFGNIANIIPGSPLKKMIPLMEDHGGGGCMGTPVGLWTIIHQYYSQSANTSSNSRKYLLECFHMLYADLYR